MAGDFNYVEHYEDRIILMNKSDKLVKRTFKPKNLNLLDTLRKLHKTKIVYTHKTARIDRIYITESLGSKISKCKHLETIADHKPVILEVNIDEYKPWGSYYWKLNSFLLNDIHYVQEIEDLFDSFELRREDMDILDNWEIFKNEIKDTSKKIASARANQRKAQILINKEIRENCYNQQILDRLDII